jgi:AraC family transcriptional regulator
VEFIEANLLEEISLETVSKRFNVSEFHFNRMFRTVTGSTLKQYILGRKLSGAMERLGGTDEKVIDIAYDFGFRYPEVFSRAFKKQFGVSPEGFRKDKPPLAPVPRAQIVERSITNYQGRLALKGEGVFLKELRLEGFEFQANVNQGDFRQRMQENADAFLARAQNTPRFHSDRFYASVHCLGEDDGEYSVFYGMEADRPGPEEGLAAQTVPEGWYERFVYAGDMFDIRESFVDDLYRWVMVKEVELLYNGVGMLNVFREDYPVTREVQILVPVKNPV